MFGLNKDVDVKLTEKQFREVTKNMSKQERRDFERKQRQAQSDREWDALMMMEAFMND